MDNNTVYDWILQTTFTVSARARSFQQAEPYLSSIVNAGDEILDLCCGSGFVSFWFEALGAKVIGIDFAPYMIALAKEEAIRLNSSVRFIEADVFTQDFGREKFDLISCFDSISDFPLSDFANLGKKIAGALKPGGRFVVKYVDNSYKYIQGHVAREGVYQEAPERITYRFKEYLPEIGSVVNIIRNESRGIQYERKGYIYTVPVVHLAMVNYFKLERHILVDKDNFVDIFVKQKDHEE